jgi:hypothetical protein
MFRGASDHGIFHREQAPERVYLRRNIESYSPLQCNIGIVPTHYLAFAVNRKIVKF